MWIFGADSYYMTRVQDFDVSAILLGSAYLSTQGAASHDGFGVLVSTICPHLPSHGSARDLSTPLPGRKETPSDPLSASRAAPTLYYYCTITILYHTLYYYYYYTILYSAALSHRQDLLPLPHDRVERPQGRLAWGILTHNILQCNGRGQNRTWYAIT